MKTKLEKRIELIQGDITQLDVDAIVNAANQSLLGGGGVDGAIHYAAGPDLLKQCRTLGGCSTGEAKITEGYRLKARWVIHTVGPIWRGGLQGEAALLESCYHCSLKIAANKRLNSVAFPSISTGVYHYPIEAAAKVALRTIQRFLDQNQFPEKVYLVCFGKDKFDVYRELMKGEGNSWCPLK